MMNNTRTVCFHVYRGISRRYFSRKNEIVEKILEEYQDLKLVPLHVAGQKFSRPFSQSPFYVWPYIVDINDRLRIKDPQELKYNKKDRTNFKTYLLDYMSLFTESSGMDILRSMYSSRDSRRSLDEQNHLLSSAVENLEMFLEKREFHEHCLSNLVLGKDDSMWKEWKVSILLANHLFGPLVASHLFGPVVPKIDKKHYAYTICNESNENMNYCPCVKECDAYIRYGDTAFGSGYLWYGRPDIMLYTIGGGSFVINIKSFKTEIVEEYTEEMDNEHLEMECKDQLRDEKTVEQVAAQAIMFSMYQTKYQKRGGGKCSEMTSLIPAIVASPHEFDIYLYDSDHDVLLVTANPIPIFEKDVLGVYHPKFNLNSILQLWMTINYLIFQPTLIKKHQGLLEGTCGVKNKIDNCNLREKIEKNLNMGLPDMGPKNEDPIRVIARLNVCVNNI